MPASSTLSSKGTGNRSRIKQVYRPVAEPVQYWYSPKWGINHLLPRHSQPGDSARPLNVPEGRMPQ